MQKKNIPTWLAESKPHFLFILTNSDVSTSKAKWHGTSVWTNKINRFHYELNNMTSYLNTHMVGKRWAFGGPTVVLEGMELFAPGRLQGFRKLSDEIYDITTRHFKANGLNYIDFRTALTKICPKWWPIYSMYATQDGEHLSELGTEIMAENYAKFILN